MELQKVKECRDAINNITNIDELEEALKVFNKVRIGCGNMKTVILPNDYTVGWCKRRFEKFNDGCIYILHGRELVRFSALSEGGSVSEDIVDFILDDILNLNTDEFYRFYFKKYGYESVIDTVKSENVKIILNEFISNNAIMNNIFTLDTYNSVTISGTKLPSGMDFEYRLVGCSKADIVELVEIVRIKPYINKRGSFDTDYVKPFNPYYGVSSSKITESYLEYKRSNESMD